MSKKKLVILCPYPNGGAPSQRFRFEQQIDFLGEYFVITQLSFWSERSNQILYSEGKRMHKLLGLLAGILRRFLHIFSCIDADIVFIHREIIPLGSYAFEWVIAKLLRKKVVFDFDDAIWHLDTSEENKSYEWLKKPEKTKNIIRLSSLVFAGNNYLKNYAKQLNSNVVVIPTTIDTNYHVPNKDHKDKICIGWTGSKTTVKHFEMITPVLEKVKKKYQQVYFKLIGDASYKNESLDLNGIAWSQGSEIKDLQELDIGIMPLPDDEWSKGKCGFKGLQYMALEIPAVMSPIGVNTEIINDHSNGFLATTEQDWMDTLSTLIESEELRNKIGKEGRKTIIDNYSVTAQKENYKQFLMNLLN